MISILATDTPYVQILETRASQSAHEDLSLTSSADPSLGSIFLPNLPKKPLTLPRPNPPDPSPSDSEAESSLRYGESSRPSLPILTARGLGLVGSELLALLRDIVLFSVSSSLVSLCRNLEGVTSMAGKSVWRWLTSLLKAVFDRKYEVLVKNCPASRPDWAKAAARHSTLANPRAALTSFVRFANVAPAPHLVRKLQWRNADTPIRAIRWEELLFAPVALTLVKSNWYSPSN